MTHKANQHPNRFLVLCCGRRRGLLPGGRVLACVTCDRTPDIPNVAAMTHVPEGATFWPPDTIDTSQ